MKKTIFLLEDDKVTIRLLSQLLEKEGYNVDFSMSVEGAKIKLGKQMYDLALFDINLPDGNGLSLLKDVREFNRSLPVVLVTAQSEIDEKLAGLEAGADDYITKPFNKKELLARIKVILHRMQKSAGINADLLCGEYMFDSITTKVTYHNITLQLKPKEFAVLKYLAAHEQKVIPSSILLKEIWNIDFDPGTKILTVSISRLRRSLKDAFGTEPVQTIIGKGYIFSSR